MKKRLMILILTVLTLMALYQVSSACWIKSVGEKIAFPLNDALDTLGRPQKPDSVHVTTYKDDGTTEVYHAQSSTWPFSEIYVDTVKNADSDTTYWYVATISDIDGTASNAGLGILVKLYYKGIWVGTRECVQIVSDSLNDIVWRIAGLLTAAPPTVAQFYGADSATYSTPAGTMGKAMSATASGTGLDSATISRILGRKIPSIRLVVHAVKNNNTFDVDTTLLGFSNGHDLLGCMVFFNRHDGRPSFFRSGINRAVNGGGYDTLTMIDTLTAVAGDTITIYPTPWWDFMPADTATDLFALNVWNTDSTQSFANASMGRLMILAAIAGADTSAFKTLLNNNGYRTAKDSINAALTIGLLKSLPRIGGLVDSLWFKLVEMNLGRINGSAAAATELKKAFDVTNPAGGGRIANVLHVDSADYVDTVRGVGSGGGSGTGSCMDLAGVRFVVNVWDGTNSAAVPNAAVTIRTSLTGTAYDHRLDTNPFGNAVFTIDPAAYYIFVESPGLNFPDSAYTIIGADSILISGTGATIVPAANATKAAVVGYLWKITSKNGVSSACANCDVIFELLGPNCSDTVQTALWVTKTVKASANANGYISAYLPLTGRMKCEDGSTPRWKMTVTVGNNRTEVTFDTPDTSTVDIGSLMK